MQLEDIIRVLRLFRNAIIILVMAWFLGFFAFLYAIPTPLQVTDTKQTDAIIVLTGGTLRLEKGLELLSQHKAKKILISGVGEKVTKRDIIDKFSNQKISQLINSDDIILGDMADSTLSNGIEAKMFMNLHQFNSMRLVTSNYHMPRSSIVFSGLMPEYEIVKHPVGRADISIMNGKFTLIFNEYNKLVALLLIWGYDIFGQYLEEVTRIISTRVYELIHPILAD